MIIIEAFWMHEYLHTPYCSFIWYSTILFNIAYENWFTTLLMLFQHVICKYVNILTCE